MLESEKHRDCWSWREKVCLDWPGSGDFSSGDFRGNDPWREMDEYRDWRCALRRMDESVRAFVRYGDLMRRWLKNDFVPDTVAEDPKTLEVYLTTRWF